MILGRDVHPASACFDEINAAVEAMTDRVVCFNAHAFPNDIPKGAIVYNLENVAQLTPDVLDRWAGHELWDFSERNAAELGAKHVPVGYHPSMERFQRADEPDIDVVFAGCLNERRTRVLEALAARGLSVTHIGPGGPHGKERDAILARAKLALNMLFYEDGVFPALRVAHLVANRVPVISERCPEMWSITHGTAYGDLVEEAERFVSRLRHSVVAERDASDWTHDRLEAFKAMPMVLPS